MNESLKIFFLGGERNGDGWERGGAGGALGAGVVGNLSRTFAQFCHLTPKCSGWSYGAASPFMVIKERL